MRSTPASLGYWFLILGLVLCLLGLLTGFAVHNLANPRMGLSAHLEGVMNGIFLAVLGLLWPRVALGAVASLITFLLIVYAAFANWLAVFLAGLWGAGASIMAIAGAGMTGSGAQEMLISFLLISLSIAMVAGVATTIWGLWRGRLSTQE